MKSYAEANRKVPFDWNEFLNQKTFDKQQMYDACYLADSWVTCACGNQCDIIPRDSYGNPEDKLLDQLGLQFSIDINDLEEAFLVDEPLAPILDRAKRTLNAIEVRSEELINELTQNEK